MRLAKPAVDVGLSTNRLQEHLAFWGGTVGLPFDAELPIGPGHVQHRFHAKGSIIKVNWFADSLPDAPAAGYREVLIAREGLDVPCHLKDPDGSPVTLVPIGTDGVRQIGIRLVVRDIAVHQRFYAEGLGFAPEGVG